MSEPRERYTPADYYERRYHLLVERFNALSEKREQLEQQLDQARALLEEFVRFQFSDVSMDDETSEWQRRFSAFLGESPRDE